ncbi:MAG TPA: AI-2E family transporter [Phycisphaerae bacterium]|nr:AI-2E family transporter [Phycisphaerae bacterium]
MDAAQGQQRIQTACLLILTAIGAAMALYWLRGIMIPLVLAVLLTYVLNPVIDFQVRHLRAPQAVGVLTTMVLAFAILGLLSLLVSTSISQLAANSDRYQAQIEQLLQRITAALPLDRLNIDPEAVTRPLSRLPEGSIGTTLMGALSAVVDIASKGLLVLVFLFFLLMGRTARRAPRAGVWGDIDTRINRYIVTKVAVSGATGVLVGLALFLLGIDLALVFGLFAFLLNFVPSLGSIIATLLPLPVVLVSPDVSATTAVLAIAVPGAIQMALGNFIEPRILGRSLDLHPIVILIALIFWGMLWGVVGMLLAAPITAVIRILLEKSDLTAPVADLLAGRPDSGSKR